MKLTTAVQEALLALICYDDAEGSVVASMVHGKHFDPVYREIAVLALEYRERHRQAPGEHTLDLVDQAIEGDPDRESLYERLHTSIRSTIGRINKRYVVDRARSFVKYQRMKRGMSKALQALERADEDGLEAAEAALTAALESVADIFDPGTKFIEDVPRSLAFLEAWDDAIPTGIPDLDSRQLGPVPGRLHLYIAPAKSGKSWWMINLATRAHQHAKRVLYVSMELSEAEISQRLVQSFWSMAKRGIDGVRWRKFVREDVDRQDWGTEWEPVSLDKVAHLTDPDVRAKLIQRFKQFAGGERLIVKTFPMGTLSTKQLDAFLDVLEHRERFVPDLLVVDYADIMKTSSDVDRWEALIDVSQNLRRIAQERNIAVATASQTKITGARAKRVDAHHVSGAWDKVATADTVVTYSQTDEERRHGLARLFVAAARTDEDRFEILLSQRYEIGQYVLSSIKLGRTYHATEEDDDDN